MVRRTVCKQLRDIGVQYIAEIIIWGLQIDAFYILVWVDACCIFELMLSLI